MSALFRKNAALFFLVLFVMSYKLYSQDEYNKWVLGIGINAVDYYPTNEPGMGGWFDQITNARDHWNIYGPKVSATRHLKNRFSIEASMSVNNITKIGELPANNLLYFALDGNIQYRLLENGRKLAPFVYGGGGYTWVEWHGAGTVNAGIGTNYWFTDMIGANVQAGLKYNSPDYALMSHIYYSLSVVFKLNSRKKTSWAGKNCN